jgi:hypothetical protein
VGRFQTIATPGGHSYESRLTPTQVENVRKALYRLACKLGSYAKVDRAIGCSAGHTWQAYAGNRRITADLVGRIATHLGATREAVLAGST